MTTVKCTCSWKDENGQDVLGCGDISITIAEITLLLHDGNKDVPGQYRFRCPKCKKIILKDAPVNIINLLYSSGVPTDILEASIEILERPLDDVPPIDIDEAIELGLALEDDEAFMRMMLGEDG